MLPPSAIITEALAEEYGRLLKGASLARVEYDRMSRDFLYFFAASRRWRLQFSFSPSDFLLLDTWTPADDGFEIWRECAGSRVLAIQGAHDNRLISLRLRKEEPPAAEREFAIIFELFGSLCNAYLLDDASEILQAARVIDDGRNLRPGKKYTLAAPLPVIEVTEPIEVARTSDALYLLTAGPGGHRVLIRDGSGEREWQAAMDFPLVKLFQHLHSERGQMVQLLSLRRKLAGRLQRRIDKQRRVLEDLQSKLRLCSESRRYREYADILMANPNARPAADSVRLHDFYHDAMIDIPTLPGKSVIETAADYYKTSKRLSRAPERLRRRIATVEDRLRELHRGLAAVANASATEQLEDVVRRLKLEPVGGERARIKREEGARPFRLFYTSAGEKIMVGKSAADNDELTFRIARSYDYWFHVQQTRGSHVILSVADKNQRPSERSLREAAAVAAYYSDSRRLEHVPVIYTRRRHVRKVRKGPPGKVIPDHLESIFVTPAKPGEKDRG